MGMLGLEPSSTAYKAMALTHRRHSREEISSMGFIYLTVFSLAPDDVLLLGVSPGVSDYASAVFCCDAASWEA